MSVWSLLRAATAVGLIAAGGTAAADPSFVTAGGITLRSVDAVLPAEDWSFPDGPGTGAVNRGCTGCHSAAMVLVQPALSATVWQAEVDKMRGVFKAPVAAEDVPAIVGYLTALRP
jgi:hypothetical protein